MNMDEQQLTYEQFKEDILRWKNTHREEYVRFARLMTNGDEKQYLAICRAIFRQLPKIKTEWELCWNDDSAENFANIDLQFKENAVPGQIVELYRKQREESSPLPDTPPTTLWGRMKSFFSGKSKDPGITLSAPLVLSWLYYGKSFEAMVGMVDRQMKNPKADKADKMSCSFVIRQIIDVSIKSGFRTQTDWDRYFSMNEAIEKGDVGEWALQSVTEEMDSGTEEGHNTGTGQTSDNTQTVDDAQKTRGRRKAKVQPLVDYLDCNDKDAVIGVIRKFISKYDTATEQALTYYALNELGLLTNMGSAKEFAAALTCQFKDMGGIKSESSYRQAIHTLTTTQHVAKDGVNKMCVMINGDICQTLLDELKTDLMETLPNPDESGETG